MDLNKLKKNGVEISKNAKDDLFNHLKKNGKNKNEENNLNISSETKFDKESIKNFIRFSKKISQ